MTLKELRKTKGLTQKESAKYLGMTERNYQYYESSSVDKDSAKYNEIYKKLNEFGIVLEDKTQISVFNMNVMTGEMLKPFLNVVEKYERRDCFSFLKKFIDGDYYGKICTLYGLRRTGKTTLLFQIIGELPLNQTAYIKAKITNSMADLTKDLNTLYQKGFKYVFIDEITLLDDFIDTAATLSDVFSFMGMKIVVSGTDSLGFAMANRDELYDRNIMIHTSFISFKEYARLLKIKSIDSYIEYGGTLKMENMNFDDPDFMIDEVSFRDDESTRKYIDTAISRNIQRTLKNDNFGEYFNQLRELYEANELTNVINRVIENINHRFVLKVIEDKFKSSDFGSAKNLLAHDIPSPVGYALTEVDYKSIIDRLKTLIDIKEKDETRIKIKEEHIEKVKKYLIMLDLIESCPSRYESGSLEEHYIFVQPGMRYAIAKALVYSLMQDEYFKTVSKNDMEYIVRKILEDVKGRMLEEIVLLETKKMATRNKEVFKFKFDEGGEFDMVIYDKISNTCSIFEIKHSEKATINQARHLLDERKCEIVENKYGKIVSRSVLYRGKNKEIDGIKYLNVEEYLMF